MMTSNRTRRSIQGIIISNNQSIHRKWLLLMGNFLGKLINFLLNIHRGRIFYESMFHRLKAKLF